MAIQMRKIIRFILFTSSAAVAFKLYAMFHTSNAYVQQISFMITWMPIVLVAILYYARPEATHDEQTTQHNNCNEYQLTQQHIGNEYQTTQQNMGNEMEYADQITPTSPVHISTTYVYRANDTSV